MHIYQNIHAGRPERIRIYIIYQNPAKRGGTRGKTALGRGEAASRAAHKGRTHENGIPGPEGSRGLSSGFRIKEPLRKPFPLASGPSRVLS